MKKFWVYDYTGTSHVLGAKTARAAVRWAERKLDVTVAFVRNAAGELVTPDLWA